MKTSRLQPTIFFSSLNLVEELTRGIQYVETPRQNRLRDCKLQDEKTLRKAGQGSHDYRVDNGKGIVVVRWFDRKAVTLVSNFVSVEPIQQVNGMTGRPNSTLTSHAR